ncbi:MAG: hypothetical protein IKV89_03585 [Clostridia bacterium]|nr:hypothetical protein [Clostridia bacterium]
MSQLDGKVTAYAEDLKAGERLCVVIFGKGYGTERVKNIYLTTATGERMTRCSFDCPDGADNRIKCFVWSDNISSKKIKVLE